MCTTCTLIHKIFGTRKLKRKKKNKTDLHTRAASEAVCVTREGKLSLLVVSVMSKRNEKEKCVGPSNTESGKVGAGPSRSLHAIVNMQVEYSLFGTHYRKLRLCRAFFVGAHGKRAHGSILHGKASLPCAMSDNAR
jgi:hypothetical protein